MDHVGGLFKRNSVMPCFTRRYAVAVFRWDALSLRFFGLAPVVSGDFELSRWQNGGIAELNDEEALAGEASTKASNLKEFLGIR